MTEFESTVIREYQILFLGNFKDKVLEKLLETTIKNSNIDKIIK
jgi:hypothetical protein